MIAWVALGLFVVLWFGVVVPVMNWRIAYGKWPWTPGR